MSRLITYSSPVMLAILGLIIARQETMPQQVITAIGLIAVSLVVLILTMRWLASER